MPPTLDGGTAFQLLARHSLKHAIGLHRDVHVVQYRVTFGKRIEIVGVLA